MATERENQINAIPVGKFPSDFVDYIERATTETLLKDLKEYAEIIKLVKDDPKYTPGEKFNLVKGINHLIKVYSRKAGENAQELYNQTSYEFYVTNGGIKILRCDESPEEGWLLIT